MTIQNIEIVTAILTLLGAIIAFVLSFKKNDQASNQISIKQNKGNISQTITNNYAHTTYVTNHEYKTPPTDTDSQNHLIVTAFVSVILAIASFTLYRYLWVFSILTIVLQIWIIFKRYLNKNTLGSKNYYATLIVPFVINALFLGMLQTPQLQVVTKMMLTNQYSIQNFLDLINFSKKYQIPMQSMILFACAVIVAFFSEVYVLISQLLIILSRNFDFGFFRKASTLFVSQMFVLTIF